MEMLLRALSGFWLYALRFRVQEFRSYIPKPMLKSLRSIEKASTDQAAAGRVARTKLRCRKGSVKVQGLRGSGLGTSTNGSRCLKKPKYVVFRNKKFNDTLLLITTKTLFHLGIDPNASKEGRRSIRGRVAAVGLGHPPNLQPPTPTRKSKPTPKSKA